MSGRNQARRRGRTVRLTTTGRKTGQLRSVTIWFVATGRDAIWVQHSGAGSAHWYHNLAANPQVSIDFGSGPIAARARPIKDPTEIRAVLRRFKRKYPLVRLFQIFGWRRTAVAAEILPVQDEAGTQPASSR